MKNIESNVNLGKLKKGGKFEKSAQVYTEVHICQFFEAEHIQLDLFTLPTLEAFFTQSQNRADFLVRLEIKVEYDYPSGEQKKGKAKYCIQYLDRKLSRQEAVLRLNLLAEAQKEDMTAEEVKQWVSLILKQTRRENRTRKNAPPAVRLKEYLKMIMKKRHKESWTYCPTYKELSERLSLSESTISRAFKALEEDCDLTFKSGYPDRSEGNPKRTRVKFVCLTKWLMYDELPLQFEKSGRERHIWDSFRSGAEKPEPQKTAQEVIDLQELDDIEREEENLAPEISKSKDMGNCQKCLSYSIRLSSKEKRQQFTQHEANASPKKRNKQADALHGLRKISRNLAREHTEMFFESGYAKFKRVNFSYDQIYNAIFYAMKRGVWRDDIKFSLRRSHEILDRDIADCMPRDAKRYWWAIYKSELAKSKQSPSDCRKKAKAYWEKNFFTAEAIELSNQLNKALNLTPKEIKKSTDKKKAVAEKYGIAYNTNN